MLCFRYNSIRIMLQIIYKAVIQVEINYEFASYLVFSLFRVCLFIPIRYVVIKYDHAFSGHILLTLILPQIMQRCVVAICC